MVVALTAFSWQAWAQNEEADGDEAMTVGLYKTAFESYKAAWSKSPQDMNLVYKLGEASRLSNDYASAVFYYRWVSRSIKARSFPDCDFHLASMYKCNGQPDSALLYFERYVASVPANQPLLLRARQEVRACQWIADKVDAPALYSVTHESKNINTANSESSPLLIGDSLFIYAVTQPYSKPGKRERVNNDLILMQIFQTAVSKAGKPGPPVPNPWGFNSNKHHTGNVAYDAVHRVMYFTRCEPDNFADIPCEIFYSRYRKGKWSHPRKLGGDVNLDGYSNTQPTVGLLPDSTAVLYFASNRPGGMGGFDIWYTTVDSTGRTTPCVNAGAPVNSVGNEITPFYSIAEGKLYFSSDWHFGYGGYDVFSSLGSCDEWRTPVNLGRTLNTPANDIYFNVRDNDTSQGFLVSNRKGSFYIAGNTCCNDIYRWSSSPVPEPEGCNCEKRRAEVRSMLPISLYFHNDEPDPKSKRSTTRLTYYRTYHRYMFMLDTYKERLCDRYVGRQADSVCAVIEQFFYRDVYDNYKNFERMLDLLADDLKNGRRVSMTVEGYASPVHTDNYNFTLSKRRIGTIVNQIMEYKQGALMKYMSAGGTLQIKEVAHGSRTADKAVSHSYTDVASSVYSAEAARERRIEILDYTYLEDDSTLISCLSMPARPIHIGSFRVGEEADIELRLPHTASTEKVVDFISCGKEGVSVSGYTTLKPGKELVVYLKMDNKHADATYSTFLPLTIRIKGENVTQTIFLEYRLRK